MCHSPSPLPCLVDGPVSQSHSPPPLRCELRLLLALWARWLMGLLTLPLTTGAGGGPTSKRCCVATVFATEADAGCLPNEISGPKSVAASEQHAFASVRISRVHLSSIWLSRVPLLGLLLAGRVCLVVSGRSHATHAGTRLAREEETTVICFHTTFRQCEFGEYFVLSVLESFSPRAYLFLASKCLGEGIAELVAESRPRLQPKPARRRVVVLHRQAYATLRHGISKANAHRHR